jgi:arginine metabolism regulation protein II
MSASLKSDLPSTVSLVLDQLDEIEPPTSHSGQHRIHDRYIGPFGVFGSRMPALSNFNAEISDPLPLPSPREIASGFDNSRPPGPITSTSELELTDQISEMSCAAATLYGGFDDFFTSSLDTMQWGDLFQWNIDFSMIAEADPQSLELNLGQAAVFASTSSEPKAAIITTCEEYSWPEIDLTNEAPLLLKHFNEEVITQMGSLPINEKSAWRILNFPSAVLTLSQLTILGFERGTIKRANLANFFALVAVSALHLSLSPGVRTSSPETIEKSYYWKSLSERAYAAAKSFLRSSLKTECTLPGKAKYKDQLMAVGAVLAIAVSSSPSLAF